MLRHRLVNLVLMATALGFAQPVAANDLLLEVTTIPASACTPRGEEDASLLTMRRGTWTFRDDGFGTAVLFCPLPVTRGFVDGAVLLAGAGIKMTQYRVYFRDSDGADSYGSVHTRLAYRDATGQSFATPGELSDSAFHLTPTPNFLFPGRTGVWDVTHEMSSDRIYFFRVELTRGHPAAIVYFAGIDFPVSNER